MAPEVSQCPFCGVREASRPELEIHLAIDHPGRVWNDRMPDSIPPAGSRRAAASVDNDEVEAEIEIEDESA